MLIITTLISAAIGLFSSGNNVLKPQREQKGPIRIASAEPNAPPVNYYWYGSHGIAAPRIHFQAGGGPNIYWKLRDAGFLRDGREKNLILLIHGWHGTHRSFGIFNSFLRFHQKMTPNVGVLLVDWGAQGADKLVLGTAAYHAIRLNINNLLKNLNNTNLHCIGHSLGAHACAAVCRNFYQIQGRKCTRIVGLDPAGPLFKTNSPYQYLIDARLARPDAEYVALFMTNRNYMGLYQLEGDEYITPYIDGTFSNHCPIIGKWWGEITGYNYLGQKVWERLDLGTIGRSGIIPHSRDSCSHLMAPILFMKSLDTRRGFMAFKWNENWPHGLPPMHTVWNGYTLSRDYRYPTFFQDVGTLWLSTQTIEDRLGDNLQYGDSNIEPSLIAIAISDKGCYLHLSIHNEYQNLYSYGNKYEIATGFANIKPGNEDLVRLYVSVSKSNCPIYIARLLIPTYHSSQYPRSTMPTYSSEIMHCSKDNSYRYFCKRTWHQSRITAYRKQLDITGKGETIPVPPISGCLDQKTNLTDMMRTSMGTFNTSVSQNITFDMNQSPFELVRITLWNPRTEKLHNLMTYWDSCDETSVVSISIDRLARRAVFKFHESGIYWISFFYEFEEISAEIRIENPMTLTTTTATTPAVTTTATTTATTPAVTTTATTTATTPAVTTTAATTPAVTTTATTTATTGITTTATILPLSTITLTTPCNETVDEDCWFAQLSGDYAPIEWPLETDLNNSEEQVDYSQYVVLGEASNYRETSPQSTATPVTISVIPGTYPVVDNSMSRIEKHMNDEKSDSNVANTTALGTSLIIGAIVVLIVAVALVMKRKRSSKPQPAIYLKVASDDIEKQ